MPQAAAQAAASKAESRVASLTTDIGAAQASCAGIQDQLQRTLQDHDAATKLLQLDHQAALHTLQAQLSEQQQLLQAAATKAEEDSTCIAAAGAKVHEQDTLITTLNKKLTGEAQHKGTQHVLSCTAGCSPWGTS